MNYLIWDIAGFLVCVLVIVYSGARLSYYGDRIAELTGLGKAWIGLILMASVTSLPELMTGLSAVTIVKAPDLAAGDIFGSCVFNLLMLSFLDARLKQPLFSLVKSSHIVAVVFGIILLTVAGMAIFLADNAPVILWMSSFTFILLAIYLIAVWSIFKYEKIIVTEVKEEMTDAPSSDPAELKKVIGGYALNALVVIGAALFLPYFGEHIAKISGMGDSFFSTLFIAAATSLPEVVVSLAALKIGSVDIAVGNLLGSNIFNMFILGLDDVFFREGSFFSAISSSHLLSVLTTIFMMAVVALGLLFKPKKKQLWLLSLDTFVILFLYVVLMTYLFVNR